MLNKPVGTHTAHNRDALPIYREAVRILALPMKARRAEIEKHPQAERLAAEVKRIWEYRRGIK